MASYLNSCSCSTFSATLASQPPAITRTESKFLSLPALCMKSAKPFIARFMFFFLSYRFRDVKICVLDVIFLERRSSIVSLNLGLLSKTFKFMAGYRTSGLCFLKNHPSFSSFFVFAAIIGKLFKKICYVYSELTTIVYANEVVISSHKSIKYL